MPTIYDNDNSAEKDVFSAREDGSRVVVRFSENGKEYSYSKERIRILEDSGSTDKKVPDVAIPIFKLEHKCWKCGQKMIIPTYINFEKRLEPLQYPWDKIRLNREKSQFENNLHVLAYTGIEYYPISVVGQNPFLDGLLVEQHSLLTKEAGMRIRNTSRMLGYFYLAAHCSKCKMVQGWFPSVYSEVNQAIQREEELLIIGSINAGNLDRDDKACVGNTVEELWGYIPD